MKQTLHIFKKDARYLRWEILLVVVFMGMFVYMQTHPDAGDDGMRDLIAAALLGTLWAFVCARLIQAEPIPGDRQFWTTRPYSRGSLLGAKLLFVTAFLTVPLLIADAIILAVEKFSIVENLAGLLLSVLFITVGVLLPLCAFATLMRSIAIWILSAFLTVGIFAGLYELSDENAWGGLAWQRNLATVAILFIVATIVLGLQYQRRRTAVSVGVMAIGLSTGGVFWEYASPMRAAIIQTNLSKPPSATSSIQIVFDEDFGKAGYTRFPGRGIDPDLPRPHPVEVGDESTKYLGFPLAVAGLSEDMRLIPDRVHVTYQLEGKYESEADRLRSRELMERPRDFEESPADPLPAFGCGNDAGAQWSADVEVSPNVHFPIDGKFFAKSFSCLSTVRLEFYVTLYGTPRGKPIDAGGGSVPVSGVGICRNDEPIGLRCIVPLREAYKLLEQGTGPNRPQLISQTSYSPLPADLSIIPLHWYWQHPSRSARENPEFTTTLEPLAHLKKVLVLHQIYLSVYQTMMP